MRKRLRGGMQAEMAGADHQCAPWRSASCLACPVAVLPEQTQPAAHIQLLHGHGVSLPAVHTTHESRPLRHYWPLAPSMKLPKHCKRSV